MSTHIDAVYVIYDTEEKKFVTYNSKGAWVKSGNAKNAFNCHDLPRWQRNNNNITKFDEQTRYKIVKLDVSLVETNFLI